MHIHLLSVPYDTARRGERMGAGPAHLLASGAARRLEERGHRVDVAEIAPPDGARAHRPRRARSGGCQTGALEGFAVEEQDELRLVGPRFDGGDCDGKGRMALKIYGILSMREGTFVIGELQEREGVHRVVLELTESGVRQVVPRPRR